MADRSLLAGAPLFADLPEDEQARLAALLRRRPYARGATIFLRGDPGASLFLIESGRVKITLTSDEGKEVVLALLGPGDVFGELSLLDGEPRSADAVALEPCQLLLLAREDVLRVLESRPRVALNLLAVLARRLRRDNQLVQDVTSLDVPARLARALLTLAEGQGRPGQGGVAIEARLTQSELAAMVGATRESVNKWLGFYARQGLIRRERGRLVVLKPEALRRRIY